MVYCICCILHSKKEFVLAAATAGAAAGAPPPRSQVLQERPGTAERREHGGDEAVHLASLQDHEERAEPHDDLPGGEVLHGAPLFVITANNRSLETLQ